MAKELEALTGDKEIAYQNLIELGAKLTKAMSTCGLETPYLRKYKRELDGDMQTVFSNRRRKAAAGKKDDYEKKIAGYQAKIAKLPR